MPKPLSNLFIVLLALGCFAFVYGVAHACVLSLKAKPDPELLSDFLAGLVTSIASVLATNLGAVLGIVFTKTDTRFRQSANWNPLRLLQDPNPTTAQIVACYVYVAALAAAAVVWGIRGFHTKIIVEGKTYDAVLPLVAELTKSLAGILVGVIAVAVNRKP